MIYKDQLHRKIHLQTVPKRIVSLVPSQTELVVDLGLEPSLVGVTKFCVHPIHLRTEKVVVGGTKTIKIEKIKSLHPDIILCNKEENTKEMIEELSEIAPVHVSDILSFEDALELIGMYGRIFNVGEVSDNIIRTILNARLEFQEGQPEQISNRRVAYVIWKKPWMVAASETFINTMLLEAGFENVFSKYKRYPEVELSNKAFETADDIFLSSEPYPFKSKHIQELRKVFPSKNIILVDGEFFSWYGSRLIKAYSYFKSL